MKIIDDLAARFGYVKNTPPPVGKLLASATAMATYPMTFQGWGKSGNTEKEAAIKAVSSAWVTSNMLVTSREFSTAGFKIKRSVDGDDIILPNHPAGRLWRKPNLHMGRTYLMQFLSTQYTLFGAAYMFLAPIGNTIAELWPIPSFMVTPIADDDNFIKHFEFKSSLSAPKLIVDPKYIVYSRLPNPFDLRKGLAPIASAASALDLDIKQSLWNSNFFGEGNAIPPAIAVVPKDVDQTDFDRIKADIFGFFGRGQRRIAVTRAGDLDFKILQTSMKDMEFLSGRRFNNEEINRAMGFPGGMWAENATEANARHAKAIIIEQNVWPTLSLLQDDINSQWLGQWYESDIYAEFDDIRPRNIEMDIRTADSRGQYWTIDELRAEDGKDPLPNDRGKFRIGETAVTNKPKIIDAQDSAVAPIDPLPTDQIKAAPSNLSTIERELFDAIMAVLEEFGANVATNLMAGLGQEWDALSDNLKAAILPVLREHMYSEIVAAATQLKIDIPDGSGETASSQWAREYSGELVKGITATTQKLIGNVIAEYNETTGMTLESVVRALEPAFGADRAMRVAVTEITRASAAGQAAYQTTLNDMGIKTRRVNHTNNDDKVCPICGPLNDKPEVDWPSSDGPPWHPSCRCFVSLELV